MTSKAVPFQGWVLTPRFEPKELTFVTVYSTGNSISYEAVEGYVDAAGIVYSSDEIYDSKVDAIAAGMNDLEKQQIVLDKKQYTLKKLIANLNNAALSE